MQTLTLQGIANWQARKAAEITIRRPQFRNPMRNTDCRNTCVVYQRTRHLSFLQQLGQNLPVLPSFAEQYGCWRLKPRAYLIDGLRQR